MRTGKEAPSWKLGEKTSREFIGLIPAGGQASRIAPLPCSKELYPIGFRSISGARGIRPKVASHYLLEKMRRAGITKAYIVLGEGKWDIPRYFGDGSMLDMSLAYLMTNSSLGPPYTLDQAYPFVRDALVAFGFPDIIFNTENPFAELLSRQSATGADAVLALLPAHNPRIVDMVDVDHKGHVRSIIIKPHQTRLRYTWIAAIWTPSFSRFMHDYLRSLEKLRNKKRSASKELSIGNVFQAAIRSKQRFQSVNFKDSGWIDIGTAQDLQRATRLHAVIHQSSSMLREPSR